MRSVPVLLVVFSFAGCDRAGTSADRRPGAPPGAPGAPLSLIATETPIAEVAAPFTLTASDGSGLELTRVDARAVVEGPLAFTELHLDFHNPEDRTREGTFAITLPAGAAVSRFAMEQGGRWQEAEVVSRPLARRAYDDFLHRGQDPALLEKAAGNKFTARVFPIPARADKHLIVSFSQELTAKPYLLPLRGLPRTPRVDVVLDATQPDGSHRRQKLSEHAWTPDRDFIAAGAGPATAAVTADTMVVATLPFTRAAGAATTVDAPRKLILAVDTSASRALGYAGYVRSVRGLVAALRARHGDPLELQVIAFDQDTQAIFDGQAAEYGDAQDRALLARGAAGASDLQVLIDVLARSPRAAHRRLAIVTDGVMTAGPEASALIGAAATLPVDRIDVVLAGGIRDAGLATALVRARPGAGDVFDLDEGAAAVASGLGEPVAVDVAVTVTGASWVYPTTLPSVRPGRPVTIHARLARPATSIDITLGGQHHTLALVAATPALISRAIAAAEVDELEQRLLTTADPAAGRALRDDIATRSVRARVLSTQTSMLVLETEADYARYHIDRDHRADILVVDATGLRSSRPALLAAAKPAPAPVAQPPADVRVGYPLTMRPSAALDDDTAAATEPRPADDGDDAGGTATAMMLDEGRMGRRDPPARADAVDAARAAGVLGSSDASAGSDDGDGTAMGGLIGADADGSSGAGTGGGGTGWGTIDTGRYGTIGHGSGGVSSGFGVGGGRGGLRGRAARVPTVMVGAAPIVSGNLDTSIIRRYVRRQLPRIRACYERELQLAPTLAGTVQARFSILPTGKVTAVTATGVSPAVAACIVTVVQGMEFPRVRGGGVVNVSYPFALQSSGASATGDGNPLDGGPAALTGQLADVMAAIKDGHPDAALGLARRWHDQAPGDVLALIALGEAQEAGHDVAAAARSYGSIIDLFSNRADLRRFAGERLERLGAAPRARALAIDSYRKAVADRPDHLTGHRLLAYALLRQGDHAAAFAAILAGVDQPTGTGRFAGADRILDEDAGMIAAAYLAAGGPRAAITGALSRRDLTVATRASTRIVLYWETDANDVDLHVTDRHGDHAFYRNKELRSGGALYADVITGYGPECFTIEGAPTAGPYHLAADYYARGPMGYGMGLLQVQRFDGTRLSFEDRPFVIMNDHAMVDLGTI